VRASSFLSAALAAVVILIASPAVGRPPRLEVQAVAATGSMPKGVSLPPDGELACVTSFGQANGKDIFTYDAETLTQEATIDAPGTVVESILSRDGVVRSLRITMPIECLTLYLRTPTLRA